MEKFEELENAVRDARDEAEKFYNKGVKAAGTRLRVKLQQVKSLANDIRANVSDIKNADKD